FSAIVTLGGVAGKLRLDRIPQRRIDNCLMVAKIRLFVVNDLASIDAVPQYQVERTAGEWLATREAARGARPPACLDSPGCQCVLQQPDRAKFGIAAKNAADDFRLVFDDDELAVSRPIPERWDATHPHPFSFRGGDLVANAPASG